MTDKEEEKGQLGKEGQIISSALMDTEDDEDLSLVCLCHYCVSWARRYYVFFSTPFSFSHYLYILRLLLLLLL